MKSLFVLPLLAFARRQRKYEFRSDTNICIVNNKQVCCDGWARNHRNECSRPICVGGCGSGSCHSPNTCRCVDRNGRVQLVNGQCQDVFIPEITKECTKFCNQGLCRFDSRGEMFCRCPAGYKGEECGQATCEVSCLNGGECVGPNACQCPYGYDGPICENHWLKGNCYTKVEVRNDTVFCLPENMLDSKVSMDDCCSTVGHAWGDACQACPLNRPGNCKQGTKLNPITGNCDDIDECRELSSIYGDICKNGECVNNDGSFECICEPGYKFNPDTLNCDDVNECEDPEYCPGFCQNTDGSYVCHCPPDHLYSADGKRCIPNPIGLCYLEENDGTCTNPISSLETRQNCCCSKNGKCSADQDKCPAKGSHELLDLCTATEDFFPHGVQPDGETGPDMNGILPDGYYPNDDEDYYDDGKNALDSNFPCQNGELVTDAIGNQRCECNPGYELDNSNNCVDTNECLDGQCQNGKCINTNGSFQCICPAGYENRHIYTQSGVVLYVCEEIDECADGLDNCGPNGECVNTAGDYECLCGNGYEKSDDGHECVDRNECEDDAGVCENGKCENTDGGYKCVCEPGYRLSPLFSETGIGEQCVDIDECAEGNPCENGECVNTDGSYTCDCDGLFEFVDGKCVGKYFFLKKQIYLFNCEFNFLVTKAKGICYRDLDLFSNQCKSENAVPTPLTVQQCCCALTDSESAFGSDCTVCPERGTLAYANVCNIDGVPYDPTTDPNYDPCAVENNPCEHGVCHPNPDKSYQCLCEPGYKQTQDGTECVDINECDDDICSGNTSKCTNTDGSYTCECGEGYVKNEDVCEDVDECLSNPCSSIANSVCENAPGGFKCLCEPGLEEALNPDGTLEVCLDNTRSRCWNSISEQGQCEDSRQNDLSKEECCNTNGAAWGENCESCEDYVSTCDPGYKWDNEYQRCVDINECEAINDCEGVCINTQGSYRCICENGLTLGQDGKSCIDERLGNCYSNWNGFHTEDSLLNSQSKVSKAVCCCGIGKAWSYLDTIEACPNKESPQYKELCLNNQGFGPDGNNDSPFAVCNHFSNICGPDGKCIDTPNSDKKYKCDCNSGYGQKLPGKKCEDINECKIDPDFCQHGKCTNTEGSFQCVCEPGYELNDQGTCSDIDECLNANCLNGECVNTDGGYTCKCDSGFVPSLDGKSCEMIQMCLLTPDLCLNGRCINMVNSYQCDCNFNDMEKYVMQENRNGQYCADYNECDVNNGGCQTSCHNNDGSFTCSCNSGFELCSEGRNCLDIDECSENPSICGDPRFSNCINTYGSFTCSCEPGYELGADGFCVDVDECLVGDVCNNGDCTNLEGGFTCDCAEGFCLNKMKDQCVDEDECQLGSHNCH